MPKAPKNTSSNSAKPPVTMGFHFDPSDPDSVTRMNEQDKKLAAQLGLDTSNYSSK